MKKMLIQIILSLGITAFAVGQTTDQIEDFKIRVTKAWESGKKSDFQALYDFDETPDEIREMGTKKWLNYKLIKDVELEIVEYLAIEEVKKRIAADSDNSDKLKSLVQMAEEKRTMKNIEYIASIPLKGVLVYKIKGNASDTHLFSKGIMFSPVGIKDEKLLFTGMRPTNKG
jgi:hypothetical protein